MSKKILSAAFAVLFGLMTAFTFQGCGGRSGVDKTKTQFRIGNFDGGVGSAWLTAAKKKFEDMHAETQFESNKKGIQIWIDNNKDNYVDDTFFTRIGTTMNQDMHVSQMLTYSNFVNAGKFADITDVVTGSEDGKDSIEAKMKPALKPYYNVDGKYYGVPFIDALYGIVYDAGLFEDFGFYDKGPGPDGEQGTYDDGLPQTWQDFERLMDDMVNSGVTPFTWTGMYVGYRTQFLRAIMASYEGSADYMLNINFSGTHSTLGDININNGWKLTRMNGKLAAMKFAEKIFSGARHTYHSRNAMGTSQTHTEAQSEFLYSVETNKRIAMLIEGGWWENEARDTFNIMSRTKDEYAYGKRKLKFMPMPRFTAKDGSGTYNGIPDQLNTKTTVVSNNSNGMIVVNAKSKYQDIAKQFIKFLHSDEMLAEFTVETGIPRPFNYSLSGAQYNALTPFAKSVWDIITDKKTDVIYPLITNRKVTENIGWLGGWYAFFSKIGGATKNDVFTTFYNEGVTAASYFQGMQDYYPQGEWESKFPL